MQISIKDLNHQYDGRDVLNGIKLEFEKGKFYGIIGPNGSGKTTLLKLIAQLLKSPKDKIWLCNQEITSFKEKERAKKIALVPQMFNLDFAFSVEEIVAMGRYPYLESLGDLQQGDHKIVHEALEKTDLLKYKGRDVNTLSGGELQRVILARALAQKTEILLLDEPLSHLDLHHQLAILNLMRQLCKELGITVICVMHDLNLTMKYCDQAIMLRSGSIFTSGQTDQVLTKENIQEVYDILVDVIDISRQKTILY